MDGGTHSANNKDNCQICEDQGHKADKCPWIHMRCCRLNCNGVMLLYHSQLKESYDKKYMKCQYDNCSAMFWLEDVMKKETKQEKHTYASSSSSSSSTQLEGCFGCGEIGHWVRQCPWKETKCPRGCEGTRKLLISGTQRSCGEKFLKCLTCDHFEWLKTAKSRKVNVRVKLEVDLNDICKEFERKFTYNA